MDVYLLGPVEARLDERPIALGAPKQRAVLAMLALAVGRTVSGGVLAEGLWGAQPPPSAVKMVQKYVSRLRRVLAGAGAEIVTHGQGYELRLGDGEVDAIRFERLLAADRAREAIALWRGNPLCDLADEPFAAAEIRRLQELRLRAGELAVDADLAAGRHAPVLLELEALLEAQPLRERLHAQHMLALYRCGRQSDALAAYRDARELLVERIGVEPGPDLRRLHEAILRQDASLELPAGVPELDTRTPLIGREHELAWLRHHWRRAQDGDGGLVVVAGERGSGKTRLLAELAAQVRQDGGAVVVVVSAAAAVAAAAVATRPTLLVLDGPAAADLAPCADLGTVLIVATAMGANGRGAADALTLAPLDADAVRAVARGYADADVPVERLLRASDGNPRRLHAAAAGWAQERAARRVDLAATRIATERPVLRRAEDALVTRFVELQATREAGVRSHGVVCPFKGLAFFDVEDSEFFCGRERLVAEMVARATGAPLLGIVGASGSGKSSALRAGLLAALAAGMLPGSEDWPQALLRPGARPMQALEQATAGMEPRVVAIDQFEELFTACRDERERAAFADALVRCTRDGRRRVLVLIAVRADYYARCAAYPELARLLAANHILAGPMRRHELRRAIEQPALRGGLHVEPDLVDALVAGVEGQPGALPLLSTSLLELWERRDGRVLRLPDYEHAGGVEGAVARLAERAYERLDPEQREAAARVLLRLAAEGEDGAVVRRRVALADLGAPEVVTVLADERLVTIADGDVEVAHEALLREWPRLRDWLQEDAQARRLHRHLSGAAREWLDAGRDASELYRGARLSAGLDWSAGHEPDLTALEREFLAASRAEAAGESARQRRANRRLRALLGGVAVLLVLAVVVGAVAIEQRGAARHAALVADAQRVGAQALTRDHLDEALLLARAGVELDDSAATRSQLLTVLMRQPQALGMLTSDGTAIHHAALSPDGRLIALAGGSDTVTIIDTAGRKAVGRPYRVGGGGVWDLKFSPDGRTLAVTGFDIEKHGSGGVVDLVDARTHARRLRIVLPRFPEPAAWLGVNVLFGPDGRELIVQQVPEPINVDGPPSVLRRFDVAGGRAVGPPVRVGRAATISMWSTSDRRALFVTSRKDRETYMLSDRLRVLRSWPVGDFAGTVNADGSAFALGSEHGAVRLLDLRTGRVRSFSGSHAASVLRMRFTDGGRTLVTTGADGKVIVWDVARGEIRREMPGHATGLVWGLDIAADGRTAYSGGQDERAFVWDLAGDRSLVRPFTVDRAFVPDDGDELPRGLALSRDGRTLAVGHSDGMVDLLDTTTLRARASVRALRGFVAAVDFSPDGRTFAATGQFGQLTLWDARTLRALGELKGQQTTSQALAFSPDGASLAAAELGVLARDAKDWAGGSVRVWDLRRPAAARLQIPLTAAALEFSRDGRLLAMTARGSAAEVRDARSGRLVARLRSAEDGRSVSLSPNGSLLATGHYDGTVRLWSTASWQPVGKPLEGHDGKPVLSLHFTRDGSMLAAAGQDGTVQLADVAGQTPIGVPLRVEPDSYLATAVSPDTRRLFAVSATRAAVRWTIAPEAWKRHACQVAGRELTRREWHDAMPSRPYRPLCRDQVTRG